MSGKKDDAVELANDAVIERTRTIIKKGADILWYGWVEYSTFIEGHNRRPNGPYTHGPFFVFAPNKEKAAEQIINTCGVSGEHVLGVGMHGERTKEGKGPYEVEVS